ncbi:MAG TPA: hypothetical protein VGP92_09500 [Acidimicrobiia bacterium]|nr:hypothetical protein [Acidimicrobiia bacterium]
MAAEEDARYAQVLSFPNARELRRRIPPLVGGLFVLGFAISVSVRAQLGVSPWDVFHQGIAEATGLSFGLVVVLVGLVVLLTWIPLHQRLGVGTVLNTLSVGFIANLGLYLIPEQHRLVVRIPMLLASIVMFGVGGGLYIGSGLGPGPRDGLMTAIARRGHRIWVVRTVLECSALAAGFLLGGHIGVGTVLLALTIGPVTHAGLRRFHLPVDDHTPEVLGE